MNIEKVRTEWNREEKRNKREGENIKKRREGGSEWVSQWGVSGKIDKEEVDRMKHREMQI